MRKPAAEPPSRLLLALTGAVTALMHALPIGVVQFADYASDIGVILTFFESGDSTSGWLGLGFIIASIAAVWLATFIMVVAVMCDSNAGAKEKQLLRMMVGSALLAPLNLHTLYLATVLARCQAKMKTLAANSTVPSETWQVYDAAQEALKESYRFGDETRIKAALKALEAAQEGLEFKEYFDEANLAGTANLFFVLSKAVETALEALPLSVLTASALFSDELPESFGLLASSLGLSLLSMAYGLFGCCCMSQKTLKDDDDIDPTQGRQGTIFMCILINVSWAIFAMGAAYGSLGEPWKYLFPGAVFCLFFVVIGLPAACYGFLFNGAIRGKNLDGSADSSCGRASNFSLFWAVLFVSAIISFESCPIDLALMFPGELTLLSSSCFCLVRLLLSDTQLWMTRMVTLALPAVRRLLLISMVGWAIAMHFGPIRTIAAVTGGLLDMLATRTLFRVVLGKREGENGR